MLTVALIHLALFLLTVGLTYIYLTGNNKYWKVRDVDFIPPKFPLGNFHDVIFGKSSIGVFLQKVYNSSTSDLVGFWIFRTPHLLIRSPEIIKNVLVKDFNYFSDRTILSDEKVDPISSQFLLTMKNPEWKHMRTKVSPIFTSSKLKHMSTLINKAAEDLSSYLSKVSKENNVVEVKELAAKYTTDLVVSSAFGVDAHSFEDDNAPFRVAGRRLLDITLLNGVRFISYFLVPNVAKLFKIQFFDPVAINFLKDAFWKTIQQREQSAHKRNDLIDIIIQMKKEEAAQEGIKFDGDKMVAQAIQFYIAGFETTSSTITYTLYELALNQDVQSIARKEIRQVFEENNGFTYDSLPKLKYLEKVIAETLRKYPPLPFLDRRCLNDYKEPTTGLVIEKGTPVFIPMLALHMNPKYFPDPEKFDPERFTEENVRTRTPYTYMPFGTGPHNCIGERFAMIATKLGMANILLNYEVRLCEETQIPLVYNPVTFIMQILGPLKLSFSKVQ